MQYQKQKRKSINNNDVESNNTGNNVTNINRRKENNDKMTAINLLNDFPFVSVAKNVAARPYAHVAGTPSLSSKQGLTMMTKTNGFPVDWRHYSCILLNIMISSSCWLQFFYGLGNDFLPKNYFESWSIFFWFVFAVFEVKEHINEYIHIYIDFPVRFRAFRISNKIKGFSLILVS